MHHSVQERPEKDIGEKTPDQAPSEEQPPGFEAFVPLPSSLENEQQRQEKGGQEIENEAVQSSQSQDACSCPRQSGHRGAAVIQHGGVSPHGHFADELRTFSLGYDCCHVGSGHL